MLLAIAGYLVEREFGPWWALVLVLTTYGPGLVLMKPLNSLDMELLTRWLQSRTRFFEPFVRKG
jgi:hypothetical protein